MRPTINKSCLYCNKQFAAQIRFVKNGGAKFCSVQCTGKHRSKIPKTPKKSNTTCAWCKKDFYKKLSSKSKNHSKSGLFFCSRKHKDAASRIGGLDQMQLPHYKNGKAAYRANALRTLPNKCYKCEYKKCTAALDIHHIDENRNNNDISNLKILCSNCHREHHAEQKD